MNQYKIYCIIGKSAVGKSTVEKMLEQFGHKRVISDTTRPMRSGEIDGKDYNFVADELFKQRLLEGNYYAEHTCYRGWYYGVSYKELDFSNNNVIIVIEPTGFNQLIESFGEENVIGIYLHVDDLELLRRALNRAKSIDQIDEIWRRYYADKELFEGIGSKCKHIIESEEVVKTAFKIHSIMQLES